MTTNDNDRCDEYDEYRAEEERKAHEQAEQLASACPLCGDFTGGGYCSICIRETM